MQIRKALRARQTRNLVSTNMGVRCTFCRAPEPWKPEAEGPCGRSNHRVTLLSPYSVMRHNLTPEEVDKTVRDLAARLFGLFVVDQHREHSAPDAKQCDDCRRDVERTSHVQPKPMPKRRHE